MFLNTATGGERWSFVLSNIQQCDEWRGFQDHSKPGAFLIDVFVIFYTPRDRTSEKATSIPCHVISYESFLRGAIMTLIVAGDCRSWQLSATHDGYCFVVRNGNNLTSLPWQRLQLSKHKRHGYLGYYFRNRQATYLLYQQKSWQIKNILQNHNFCSTLTF